MESIIGHRTNYAEVGASRGQWHTPSKNSPKYPPPPQPRDFLVGVYCPVLQIPTFKSLLLRLGRQQKDFFKYFSNLPITLSFLFILKRQIRSYSSSKTIPDSGPKWEKSIPVVTPKRRKNHTLRGGTYLYGLYKRVSPPPPGTTFSRALARSGKTLFPSLCWLLSLIFIRKA